VVCAGWTLRQYCSASVGEIAGGRGMFESAELGHKIGKATYERE
jgi:hypothetical protein